MIGFDDAERTHFLTIPSTLKAMLLAERMQNERLRQIIKELQRHRFGRGRRRCPRIRLLLGLEDVEQAAAEPCRRERRGSAQDRAGNRAHKRRINRGALPAHLPRIEIVVDIDDKTCPCCQGALHRIGEDSERAAGHRAGPVPGARHPSAEICLPSLRGRGGAGRRRRRG